ncbi:plectin-like isoform X1, partial [Clarias magur]
MDALHDWVLTYPAPARLVWVLALVLATLLVWSLFFCCWETRNSVSPLERYLSAMKKTSKTKHQNQEEKAEKQGEQENPTKVRKRNKRRLKVTIAPETITFESAEKAMSVTSRPRLRERSASEESRSELCSSALPGDTLPWNLAKHQRVKRSKSASGDVLDPAERAVIRIA